MLTHLALLTLQNRKTDREIVAQRSGSPVAVVGSDIADAFEMTELPNVVVIDEPPQVPETGWNSHPNLWKPDAVRYFVETMHGGNVSHDYDEKHVADFAEMKASAEHIIRAECIDSATVDIDRKTFLADLRQCKKHGGKLGNVELSVDDITERVELVSTADEQRYVQRVEHDSTTVAGSVVVGVPVAELTNIVNKLKGTALTFRLTACEPLQEYKLTLSNGSATFNLDVDPPRTEPVRLVSAFPATSVHVVKAGELLTAIEAVDYCTDDSSTRYALSGALLEFSADAVSIVTTDSRRLAFRNVPADVKGAPVADTVNHVFPGRLLTIVRDELKSMPADSAVYLAYGEPVYSYTPIPDGTEPGADLPTTVVDGKLYYDCTRVELVIESESWTVRAIPVEGRFPKYRDVVPQQFDARYTFDRSALLEAVETVEVMCDSENRGGVFDFGPHGVTVDVAGTSGNASATVPAVSVGSVPVNITLDVAYVQDFLKHERTENVEFALIDREKPVLLSPINATVPGGYVAMPLSRNRM